MISVMAYFDSPFGATLGPAGTSTDEKEGEGRSKRFGYDVVRHRRRVPPLRALVGLLAYKMQQNLLNWGLVDRAKWINFRRKAFSFGGQTRSVMCSPEPEPNHVLCR